MDFGTLAAIAGVLVTAVIAVLGAVLTYGMLRQQVKDHEEELSEVKTELKAVRVLADEAKTAALAVNGLASAVEHLGQQLTNEIKHVVSTFSIETGHTRAQLAEIKEELRARDGRARRSTGG